jgi:hypothetical protein
VAEFASGFALDRSRSLTLMLAGKVRWSRQRLQAEEGFVMVNVGAGFNADFDVNVIFFIKGTFITLEKVLHPVST